METDGAPVSVSLCLVGFSVGSSPGSLGYCHDCRKVGDRRAAGRRPDLMMIRKCLSGPRRTLGSVPVDTLAGIGLSMAASLFESSESKKSEHGLQYLTTTLGRRHLRRKAHAGGRNSVQLCKPSKCYLPLRGTWTDGLNRNPASAPRRRPA